MDFDFFSDFRMSEIRHRQESTDASVRDTQLDQREMQRLLRKMALVNQSLFELLKEKTGITDEDLRRKMREVDLRDGVEDGRLDAEPMMCGKCGHNVTSGAIKCMHCGATITPRYPYEA